MKIEFAPLSVPLQRRLQTASVVQWVFSFLALAQCCVAAFIALLFTRFWLLCVLYAVWWFKDRDKPSNGGRRIHAIRNSVVWRYMRDYFPLTLVKTAELDPRQNYLMGFHPHGVLATGAFLNFCTEASGFSTLFPGITPHLMMLSMWFHIPFFREYLMSGGLVPSDKESASYVLKNPEGGNVLAIIIGGAQEALEARPGSFTLLLKNRKGFVRLAIEHGTPLVPVFSFGENDLFNQVRNPQGSWLRKLQLRLQKIMGVSLPLFHARGIFQYSFGLVPYRRPIYTVVGKPIPVQRKHKPSEEEVDRVHEIYLKELNKLFEEHKARYNIPEDRHLEFI
ncbi:2-acylglycerol O-acyltransferase 2 [Strigops habroptila]|uniref:Acyltransferase n=1 Tax=Strigops habroptila TaxID=2489341 RepID=A0A672V7G3_STRHB|nr:2-acylglycerol O-acyltransferase 2 [Strigops habroptila]XP_030332403.1 2-acylglycerol O-acyltransferase 2 [Strigops habroptila]